MSRAGDGRFQKGQSGNPKGRPKSQRPYKSAFDIVIEKSLTVTQNGVERELTIDEALEWQTYQAALGGSRMAIRKVLKMIERREAALAWKAAPSKPGMRVETHYSADNANEAMRILDIAAPDPEHSDRWRLKTWVTQAALSRPGRRRFEEKNVDDIKFFTSNSENLKWPRGTLA